MRTLIYTAVIIVYSCICCMYNSSPSNVGRETLYHPQPMTCSIYYCAFVCVIQEFSIHFDTLKCPVYNIMLPLPQIMNVKITMEVVNTPAQIRLPLLSAVAEMDIL